MRVLVGSPNMKTQYNDIDDELEELENLQSFTAEEAKQYNELMDRVLSTLPDDLSEWRLK